MVRLLKFLRYLLFLNLFKNILCYGSALLPSRYFRPCHHLKTSYVMVRPDSPPKPNFPLSYLKTSYVMVRPEAIRNACQFI